MNLAELLNNIIQASKERLKNPFFGAYFLAFVFWNWQPIIYFMLSDRYVIDRINYITTNYNSIWDTLIIPIVIAFIYNIAPPYIMVFVDWLSSRGKFQRLEQFNMHRSREIDLKLSLASKETILKDSQSRERQLEIYLNKCNLLESEKTTLQLQLDKEILNSTSIAKELNSSINENKKLILQLDQLNIERKSTKSFITRIELFELAYTTASKRNISLTPFSKSNANLNSVPYFKNNILVDYLLEYEFIEIQNNEMRYTQLGVDFAQYIFFKEKVNF